ncbi:O-antigen ligase family protein [Bombilactobacillus folatiphilus]|uniref:O-antigen ligase family protein n=1 Tax=Bombilactobacillus folatiphilus TaxID=2923362 RepID=A0ABY4P889_9LACO|nr:O-antigen ligase family protein [Bombilactobacillus folatiphilus]UQS81839.1 O-antigen ligase family protein [Bombilactobacillus folatiphilus]
MLYILVQPLLDVVTGWQVKLMPHFGLTIGVVIRAIVLVLIVFFIYLAARQRANWFDHLVPWYLGLLFLLVLVNLLISKLTKPNFSLFTEIAGSFKSVHYLLILLGMYYAFVNLTSEQIKRAIPAVIYWAQMMINVVMLIAAVTKTAFLTYPQGKLGQSGWFNAGNELGAILAITFPLVLLYAIQRSRQKGNYWAWLGVILGINSVIMVGTKSCFYGMLIALMAALVYEVVMLFLHTKPKNRKANALSTCLLVLLLGGVFAVYPQSPVHNNSAIQNRIIRENQKNKKKILKEKKRQKHMDHYEKFLLQNKELSNPLVAKLLSGRTNYFRLNSEQYAKAPLSQKLFGMGYGGNYLKVPRTVEMDWVDFFFQFGLLGFVITIVPLIGLILYLLYQFCRHFLQTKIQDNLLYFVSFGLGIFMSILSGHVLNAPGVSLYFGLVGAYLIFLLQDKPRGQRQLNTETISFV